MERGEKNSGLLEKDMGRFDDAIAATNSTRALQLMLRAIGESLEDQYARGGGGRRGRTVAPAQEFVRRHMGHPLIYQFARAFHDGSRGEIYRLAKKIKASGWKEFPGGVHPDNLRPIYKYIERADGRHPAAFVCPCAGARKRGAFTATLGRKK